MTNKATIEALEERLERIGYLENQLQVLYIVRQTTVDPQMSREVASRFNSLNLEYAKLSGKEYKPK